MDVWTVLCPFFSLFVAGFVVCLRGCLDDFMVVF